MFFCCFLHLFPTLLQVCARERVCVCVRKCNMRHIGMDKFSIISIYSLNHHEIANFIIRYHETTFLELFSLFFLLSPPSFIPWIDKVLHFHIRKTSNVIVMKTKAYRTQYFHTEYYILLPRWSRIIFVSFSLMHFALLFYVVSLFCYR